MKRTTVAVGLIALALAASVFAAALKSEGADQRRAAEAQAMPILLRCPRAGDGLHAPSRTANQVIAIARRVNSREVTHYQGRTERRTAANTPVVGVVMDLGGPLEVPGRLPLAALAKKRCGKLALAASAVTFHDSLSPICCQTFTLLVARGSKAWIVFKA